jgi:hypothetical protein
MSRSIAGLAFQSLDDRLDGEPGHVFRVLGDGDELMWVRRASRESS